MYPSRFGIILQGSGMNVRGLTNEIGKETVCTRGFVRLTGLPTPLNVLVCTKIVMGPQARYMTSLLP